MVLRSEVENILTSNQVFKIKDIPPTSRAVGKSKNGLVARGFQQGLGIGYNKIFAPVVNFSSIHCLLAFVAHINLKLHQMDIVTAFLHGEAKKNIYLEVPDVVVGFDRITSIWKLVKALYGLQKAPRGCNLNLDHFLKSVGFNSNSVDSCLFLERGGNGEFLIVALYVHDLFLAANNMKSTNWMKLEDGRAFEMKDLREAEEWLGLEIERHRDEWNL